MHQELFVAYVMIEKRPSTRVVKKIGRKDKVDIFVSARKNVECL